ncbi:MAG: HsdM family class I SAM-dependent methyltransferase [Phocaeicola sp.]|uniref:HsdM family class I SAM-dependent methyltransferase n=1 Tax=Phocaeicola sp. TaxID=2773926 RepID=UPI003FA0E64C
METLILNNLIKSFSIEDIEKHLVYSYIKSNSIEIGTDNFISQYLDGFTPCPKLTNEIDKIEIASIDDMSIAMELLIPTEDKKVNGAFFTPAYIADFILKTIKPEFNAKIIDPSCGSGAFLLAIARYYKHTFGKSISDCICENIYGSDILYYNIERCKLLLSLLALSESENISVSQMNLFCCDSLKHNWNENFDAVVGNPPYVKFQDMDDDTRAFLIANYRTTQFGTYNLYFAFFELGLRILKTNGKLGYITPNNYFTSLSGESLRAFFRQERSIYRIVDFNATKVFNVQTYTAISFLNKESNENIEYDRIKEGVAPELFLKETAFTLNPYSSLDDSKWRLLCGDERHNIAQIEGCGERIGNLFNICVGIATLKDEIYFIQPISEDIDYYNIARNGLLFRIEKNITRSVVKISDMKTPEDINQNTRRIIFPYTLKNGKATAIQESVMQSKYPECYKYLLSVKDVLAQRGKGKHVYTPFYAYGRTQGLNRTGVKLLTPTFSKTPRFLFDQDPNGFFTNGYGVYLRPQERNLFDCNLIAIPENLDVMQKILNSIIMEYYVDKTSVAIEGGYPCYQKNFIERFSVPNFSETEINELRVLTTPNEINNYLISKYHLKLVSPNRC